MEGRPLTQSKTATFFPVANAGTGIGQGLTSNLPSVRSPKSRTTLDLEPRVSFGSPKHAVGNTNTKETQIFEARYTALSGLISDLNVYSVSRSLSSQQQLSAILGEISMALDKHLMANDKNLVDRLNVLENQAAEETRSVENLRVDIANKIANLLERIDQFADQFRSQAATGLQNARNKSEIDVINLRKVVTQEKARFEETRSDDLHTITQRVATVAEIVESETILFEDQKNSLVSDIRTRLEILETLVNAEQMVKQQTSRKIQDIMRETEEELSKQFEYERAAQKESKDRVKRLIYTIHRRIQQV